MNKNKALYISLDACDRTDGCGKSSQYDLLAKILKTKGYKVALTREFGSPLNELTMKFKDYSLNTNHDLHEVVRELMFSACSITHNETIKKIEKDYDIILSDRSFLSNFTYGERNTPVANEIYKLLYTCKDIEWRLPDILFLD